MHPGANTNPTYDPGRVALMKLRREIDDRRGRVQAQALVTSGYRSAVIGGQELAYDEAIRLIDDQLIRADQERLLKGTR